MAKVIYPDGTFEFLSPAAARQAVADGKGTLVETYHTYSTRQMVAEPVKQKRKRRTKAEIEADKAAEEATAEESTAEEPCPDED